MSENKFAFDGKGRFLSDEVGVSIELLGDPRSDEVEVGVPLAVVNMGLFASPLAGLNMKVAIILGVEVGGFEVRWAKNVESFVGGDHIKALEHGLIQAFILLHSGLTPEEYAQVKELAQSGKEEEAKAVYDRAHQRKVASLPPKEEEESENATGSCLLSDGGLSKEEIAELDEILRKLQNGTEH